MRGGGAGGGAGGGGSTGLAAFAGVAATGLGAGRLDGGAFRAADRDVPAFFVGRLLATRLLATRAGLRAEVRDLVTRRDLAIGILRSTRRRTRLAQ